MPVLSFTSSSGTFARLVGLGSTFTEALGSTSFFLSAFSNPVDLSVSNVSSPANAVAGDSITVTWQTNNLSNQSISANWQDSVYLSTAQTITASSILLGSVTHMSGLAANGSYLGSLTANLPALAPADYYLLVQVDSLYQVADPSRANNTSTASLIHIGVPMLVLGTPLNDSFTAADEAKYYQISVPAGGTLTIALQSAAASGSLAVYVSRGHAADAVSVSGGGQREQSAEPDRVDSASRRADDVLRFGGEYRRRRGHGRLHADGDANQRGHRRRAGPALLRAGNGGTITIPITGTNFTPATTASLTLGGVTINASAVNFVSASEIDATFNLSGAAVGAYTLQVTSGGQTVTSPATLQVVAAVAGSLNVTLGTPEFIRPGRIGTIVVNYTNTSNNDMVAPILLVSSTNATVSFSTADDPNSYMQSTQLLAVAPNGPAGILRPGESGQPTA